MIARRDVHLATDNRFDPFGESRAVELEGAKDIAVVGHGHGRHPELGDLFRKFGNPDRRVEQRVVRVQVEVNEWWRFGRSAHGAMIPRSSPENSTRNNGPGRYPKPAMRRTNSVSNSAVVLFSIMLKVRIAKTDDGRQRMWHKN